MGLGLGALGRALGHKWRKVYNNQPFHTAEFDLLLASFQGDKISLSLPLF